MNRVNNKKKEVLSWDTGGSGEDVGLISNIQRFSVNDGPGIRTTVFMKGCPLACWWCHNPESFHFKPELMVREARCRMFGYCVDACSKGAIDIDGEGRMKLNRAMCDRCFECITACPTGTLRRVGDWMTAMDIVKEIERDWGFYEKSGGGVTVSGGEPLFQGAFVSMLLRHCKELGLHTALDTCGYASWNTFEKVLKYVDLVLYDLKHLDPQLHKKATGKSNTLILRNLRRIWPDKKIWLRIPLISGFNDSEENIKKVGEIGAEIGVEKVSILPFHQLGEGKYHQLGMKYSGSEVDVPNDEQIRKVIRIIEGFGILVTVSE